jgi:DNA-binding transcriptional MerR regulator
MSEAERYLSPAEVMRSTPVSVRALKLYERRGLLMPLKTASGWRSYGPRQIARLNEIIALKEVGFSLAQIAGLFAGETRDLQSVLDAQAQLLRDRRTRADEGLRLIETTQKTLKAGASLPVSNLVEIILEATMQTPTPPMAAYLAKLKVQLSSEELVRLRDGLDTSRAALIAELKSLADRQEDPGSASAFDFMRRWSHAHRLLVGGDDALMAKAGAAWLETVSDPGGEENMPYGRRDSDYLMRIMAAIRAEWVRLFAKVEALAQAGAATSSLEAVALMVRIRQLSTVTRGHLSITERNARREAWTQDRAPLPGVTLSEPGLAFLLQAGARATQLVEAV